MTEIRVNTDDLKRSSQSLNSAAHEISSTQSQISNTTSWLGNAYDGQLRQKLEGIVGGAGQMGSRLQSRAIDLGDELLTRAASFEAANEVGRSAVLGATTAYTYFIETTPTLGVLSFLRRWKEKALSIWNSGGLAIGGFLSLLFVINKPAIPTPFDTLSKPTTNFGDLLKKIEEDKLLKEQQETLRREWWNNNGLNQRNPSIVKAMEPYGNTFNACGATVIAMLINYSNFTNNKTDQITDTASIVKWAGQQGYFKDSLLSFSELEKVANHQGFVLDSSLKADGTSPISFEDLKLQVESGNPQIVLAKYGYDKNNNYSPNASSKFDHFVIVTNISENQVTIVNPHPGKYITSSTDVQPTLVNIDEFKKVWTFDKNQSTGQGFGIKPK